MMVMIMIMMMLKSVKQTGEKGERRENQEPTHLETVLDTVWNDGQRPILTRHGARLLSGPEVQRNLVGVACEQFPLASDVGALLCLDLHILLKGEDVRAMEAPRGSDLKHLEREGLPVRQRLSGLDEEAKLKGSRTSHRSFCWNFYRCLLCGFKFPTRMQRCCLPAVR